MKDIVLYAYSPDTNFLEWLQFLLTKVEAKIHICPDEVKLESLCANNYPDIFLIDDHEPEVQTASDNNAQKQVNSLASKGTVSRILQTYNKRKSRATSMFLVLSEHYNNLEYRVDLLFNGADYIIEKPINMVELIARISAMIRHQKLVCEYLQKRVYQAHAISTFDSMERVLAYLNSHIKSTVQQFIDSSPLVCNLVHGNQDNSTTVNINAEQKHSYDEQTGEYLQMVHEGSMQVMAVIHAIRDDVQDLMHKNSYGIDQEEHLDQLFQKNLELIRLAYHDRYKEELE